MLFIPQQLRNSLALQLMQLRSSPHAAPFLAPLSRPPPHGLDRRAAGCFDDLIRRLTAAPGYPSVEAFVADVQGFFSVRSACLEPGDEAGRSSLQGLHQQLDMLVRHLQMAAAACQQPPPAAFMQQPQQFQPGAMMHMAQQQQQQPAPYAPHAAAPPAAYANPGAPSYPTHDSAPWQQPPQPGGFTYASSGGAQRARKPASLARGLETAADAAAAAPAAFAAAGGAPEPNTYVPPPQRTKTIPKHGLATTVPAHTPAFDFYVELDKTLGDLGHLGNHVALQRMPDGSFLDVYGMYTAVQSLGGFDAVHGVFGGWGVVAKLLGFPGGGTYAPSLPIKLKQSYERLLLEHERRLAEGMVPYPPGYGTVPGARPFPQLASLISKEKEGSGIPEDVAEERAAGLARLASELGIAASTIKRRPARGKYFTWSADGSAAVAQGSSMAAQAALLPGTAVGGDRAADVEKMMREMLGSSDAALFSQAPRLSLASSAAHVPDDAAAEPPPTKKRRPAAGSSAAAPATGSRAGGASAASSAVARAPPSSSSSGAGASAASSAVARAPPSSSSSGAGASAASSAVARAPPSSSSSSGGGAGTSRAAAAAAYGGGLFTPSLQNRHAEELCAQLLAQVSAATSASMLPPPPPAGVFLLGGEVVDTAFPPSSLLAACSPEAAAALGGKQHAMLSVPGPLTPEGRQLLERASAAYQQAKSRRDATKKAAAAAALEAALAAAAASRSAGPTAGGAMTLRGFSASALAPSTPAPSSSASSAAAPSASTVHHARLYAPLATRRRAHLYGAASSYGVGTAPRDREGKHHRAGAAASAVGAVIDAATAGVVLPTLPYRYVSPRVAGSLAFSSLHRPRRSVLAPATSPFLDLDAPAGAGAGAGASSSSSSGGGGGGLAAASPVFRLVDTQAEDAAWLSRRAARVIDGAVHFLTAPEHAGGGGGRVGGGGGGARGKGAGGASAGKAKVSCCTCAAPRHVVKPAEPFDADLLERTYGGSGGALAAAPASAPAAAAPAAAAPPQLHVPAAADATAAAAASPAAASSDTEDEADDDDVVVAAGRARQPPPPTAPPAPAPAAAAGVTSVTAVGCGGTVLLTLKLGERKLLAGGPGYYRGWAACAGCPAMQCFQCLYPTREDAGLAPGAGADELTRFYKEAARLSATVGATSLAGAKTACFSDAGLWFCDACRQAKSAAIGGLPWCSHCSASLMGAPLMRDHSYFSARACPADLATGWPTVARCEGCATRRHGACAQRSGWLQLALQSAAVAAPASPAPLGAAGEALKGPAAAAASSHAMDASDSSGSSAAAAAAAAASLRAPATAPTPLDSSSSARRAFICTDCAAALVPARLHDAPLKAGATFSFPSGQFPQAPRRIALVHPYTAEAIAPAMF